MLPQGNQVPHWQLVLAAWAGLTVLLLYTAAGGISCAEILIFVKIKNFSSAAQGISALFRVIIREKQISRSMFSCASFTCGFGEPIRFTLTLR